MRRHVLTLVAVFLALAVGVVLGSTSVATSIRDAVVDREETTAARLEAAQDDLAAERRAVDRLDGLAADRTAAISAFSAESIETARTFSHGAGSSRVIPRSERMSATAAPTGASRSGAWASKAATNARATFGLVVIAPSM